MAEPGSIDDEKERRNTFIADVDRRLGKLADQDRMWPGLIISRATLRVLPAGWCAGYFKYWNSSVKPLGFGTVDGKAVEPKEEDRRAYYLLAVYNAILAGWPDSDLDAGAAASIARSAFTDADAATRVAFGTADVLDISWNQIATAIKSDLSKAERLPITVLSEQPLWHGQLPKAATDLYQKKFKPAVKALKASSDADVRLALERLLKDYDAWLDKESPAASNELSPETAAVTEDRLGREALVRGLADILTDDRNTEHQTIGLFGHWGIGKSVVLNLLKDALKKDASGRRFLVGTFNAWSYEQAKNIQAAMTHEVISGLTTVKGCLEAKSDSLLRSFWLRTIKMPLLRSRLAVGFFLSRYPMAIAWVAAVGLGFLWAWHGADSSTDLYRSWAAGGVLLGFTSLWPLVKQFRTLIKQPYTDKWLTYLKLPGYAEHIGQVSEMSRDIRILCNLRLGMDRKDDPFWLFSGRRRHRLLFIVDDLDRCGPEGIVKTFEAVRLIMDIPQVTVLIAIDQRIALAAFAHHYRELKDFHDLRDAHAIARDYLSKMIHLSITLDKPDMAAANGYLGAVWREDGDTGEYTIGAVEAFGRPSRGIIPDRG